MSQIDNLNKPVEIFYSYSHKDEKLRNRLEMHLSLLKQQGFVLDWHDRKVSAGREWENEIDTYLNTAQIILLLISPDFLASEYCYSVEMKRALERHNSGEARVIPIILRPVYWFDAPFGKLEALPKGGKPITRWSDRDDAFLDVTKGIQKVVHELRSSSVAVSEFLNSDNPWDKYILVIDDDREVLEALKSVLEDEGYNVVTAENGHEASLLISNYRVDLILLDLHFESSKTTKNMQGFEILDRLRWVGSKAPVIMITGGSVYKKAFNRGVVDYIKKPFDFDEVVARVKARIKSSRYD